MDHRHLPFEGRLTKRQLLAIDVLGALLLGVGATFFSGMSARLLGVPGWAVVVPAWLFSLAFGARRAAPRTVSTVVALMLPVMHTSILFPLFWLVAAVVAYRLPAVLPWRQAVRAQAVALVLELVGAVAIQQYTGHNRLLPQLTLMAWVIQAAAWAMGWSAARGRAYQEGLREQAEQRALGRARRAVVEERLRIARELHDVVAHSMSVIAVQAGVGRHVAAGRPDQAVQALTVIEATSKSTLRELRSLLGVLRDGEAAELLPGSLVDVEVLVRQARQSGVTVEVRIDGDLDGLPHGVDFAAYRIVQESLTNVVKHARTGRAELTIVRGPGILVLDVSDEGVGCAEDAVEGGHGLVGIRERAALYGGEVSAGPRASGGFRVRARLELPAPAGEGEGEG